MNNPFDPSRDPYPPDKPVHPLEKPMPQPQPMPAVSQPAAGQPPMRRVMIQKNEPFFAYGLLGLNILIFVADYLLNYRLTDLGVKDNASIMAGQLWRFVTPIFLHGGLLHIAVNSYSLYVIGPQAERAFGRARFLAIYLLSGIMGVIASFFFISEPSLGASGALFGLIGAMVPLLYRNRHIYQNPQRSIMSLVQIVVLNLLIGLTPGIDNSAHIGGLIGGLALGWIAAPLYKVIQDFDGSIQIKDESSDSMTWALIVMAAVVIAGLAYLAMIVRQAYPLPLPPIPQP